MATPSPITARRFGPVGPAVSAAVGALILWRRPGHRMGRLLVAVGLMFAASAGIGTVTTAVDPFGFRFPGITPALVVLGEALSSASLLIGSLSVIVRFPTGRRTSRLGLVVELMLVGVILAQMLAEVAPGTDRRRRVRRLAGGLRRLPAGRPRHRPRYRRAAAVERAQFRWLIAAATVTGVLVILMLLFGNQFEGPVVVWLASTILPTVAVGVAVLRYRLYDIDRIISRSLTYGAVSLVLFAVFFGANILLQRAISPLVDGNVIATAGSTLLVASLFQPVRDGSSGVVDRRFHRARYDAERTVEPSPAGCATAWTCRGWSATCGRPRTAPWSRHRRRCGCGGTADDAAPALRAVAPLVLTAALFASCRAGGRRRSTGLRARAGAPACSSWPSPRGPSCKPVGTIIAWRRPDNRVGRIMQASGPLLLGVFLGYLVGAWRYITAGADDLAGGSSRGGVEHHPDQPLRRVPVGGRVFPDGASAFARGSPGRCARSSSAIGRRSCCSRSRAAGGRELPNNPFGILPLSSDVHELLNLISTVALIGGLALAVGAVITRWRRGDPLERAQLKWLLGAFAISPVLFAISWAGPDEGPGDSSTR